MSDAPPFKLRSVLIFVAGGWIAWLVLVLLVAFGFFDEEHRFAVAGQIGDLFGGVNALFTALAFAMVWWSGDMQRRELSLQRRDLELQLDELKAQREELIETRAVFKRQNFEAAFFQQLNVVMGLARDFRMHDAAGSEAFKFAARTCRNIILARNAAPDSISDIDDYREYVAEQFYEKVYRHGEAEVGSYLRTLYHLFKLVDSQDFGDGDKVSYSNIIRAQLSADVLLLISCNAVTTYGSGFVYLIEKYGILKHISNDVNVVRIRALYCPTAFMGKEERRVYLASQDAF